MTIGATTLRGWLDAVDQLERDILFFRTCGDAEASAIAESIQARLEELRNAFKEEWVRALCREAAKERSGY